jgi:parallel beta-helix repeat protein
MKKWVIFALGLIILLSSVHAASVFEFVGVGGPAQGGPIGKIWELFSKKEIMLAPVTLTECTTITQPGTYYLPRMIMTCNTPNACSWSACFKVQASDVILDGQNRLLSCSGNYCKTWIDIDGNAARRDRITIRNIDFGSSNVAFLILAEYFRTINVDNVHSYVNCPNMRNVYAENGNYFNMTNSDFNDVYFTNVHSGIGYSIRNNNFCKLGIDGGNNYNITNNHFENSYAYPGGVWIIGEQNTIDGNEFEFNWNQYMNPIEVTGQQYPSTVINNIVSPKNLLYIEIVSPNARIEGNTFGTIRLAVNGNNADVNNNIFTGGWVEVEGNNAEVDNNIITGLGPSSSTPIAVWGDSAFIHHNALTSADWGISCQGANARINDNTLAGGDMAGVYFTGNNAQIKNNNIAVDFSAIGIATDAGNGYLIQDNIISVESGSGIEINGGDNGEILHNSITGGGWGLSLVGGTENPASYNTVDDNDILGSTTGVILSGAQYNTFTRNIIEGETQFYLEAYRNVFENNNMDSIDYSTFVANTNTFINNYIGEMHFDSIAPYYLKYFNDNGEVFWENCEASILEAPLYHGYSLRMYPNSIRLHTGYQTSLAAERANITINNLSALNNPVVMRNGIVCDGTTTPSCSAVASLGNGKYKFNINYWDINEQGWVEYKIVSGGCGNGICDAGAGENCGTCVADCGCQSEYSCVNGACTNSYQVTGCQIINQPGTYTLQNDISFSPALMATPCLQVTVSDVVIDGNQHWIDGSEKTKGRGIEITTTAGNVDVKNFKIKDVYFGVYIVGDVLKGLHIENNHFEGDSIALHGLYTDGAIIENNDFVNNDRGISFQGYLKNVIVQNNVIRDCAISHGLSFYGEDSTNNLISGNEILNNAGLGLFVRGTSTIVEDNIVEGNGKGGNYGGAKFDGAGNTLKNNEIFDNDGNDVEFTGANLIIYNNEFGEVKISNWVGNITGDIGLEHGTRIAPNFAEFDEELIILPAPTTQISFFDMVGAGFTDPKILRNNLVCDETTTPRCDALTPLDADTVTFTTTGWSNYRIGEVPVCVHGETRLCPLVQGVCAGRQEECVNGEWNGYCFYGSDYEETETRCDELDNDCDGQIDESLARECGVNAGVCSLGTETCSVGVWVGCTGIEPSIELCDGLDNDCDGNLTDDGDGECFNHCISGDCVQCIANEECGEGFGCVNNVCIEIDENCFGKENGFPCDDGLYCTNGDSCSDGSCVAGEDRECNDDVGCTLDVCDDVINSCVYTSNDSSCDDGIGCTTDSCDAILDCQKTAVNSRCNDPIFCDGEEICDLESGCIPGTPISCSGDDGVACTQNICVEENARCEEVANDTLCGIGICLPEEESADENGCFDNTEIICGNGIVEAGEDCDGTNLSEATCAGEGYPAGGNLNCSSCNFNYSGCSNLPLIPMLLSGSTNFSAVSDIRHVENATLVMVNGRINFSRTLNFERIDLINNLKIEYGRIGIDVSNPRMHQINSPAELTFEGIGQLGNPSVVKLSESGIAAICDDCTLNFVDGKYNLGVPGFSYYLLSEKCGNGICESGESCSFCLSDCGVCPNNGGGNNPGGNGPSGGGTSQCSDGRDNDGDGAIDYPNDLGCVSRTDNSELDVTELNSNCVEIWECSDWGVCEENVKTKSCEDANSCGTTLRKPQTSIECDDSGGGGIFGESGVRLDIVFAFIIIAISVIFLAGGVILLIRRKLAEPNVYK